MPERDERVPCYNGFIHTGSCIGSHPHIVFNRRITDSEWSQVSMHIDEAWNDRAETWDADTTILIFQDICPDIEVTAINE